MDTYATLSIPADDEGYIALQCPQCANEFKVRASDLDQFDGMELFCTSCGLSHDRSQFLLTPNVQAAAQAVVQNMAIDLINDFAKNLERQFRQSKFIKVSSTPLPKRDVPRLRAFTDLAEAEVPCCETTVKLSFDQAASLFYCPYCGNAQR